MERDYQELKQELGLGRHEGRGWRDFQHHATPVYCRVSIPASGAESFFPSARVGNLGLSAPSFRRISGRGVASEPSDTIRSRSHRLIGEIAQCPLCGSRST
jgi:hypothetical protein